VGEGWKTKNASPVREKESREPLYPKERFSDTKKGYEKLSTEKKKTNAEETPFGAGA